MAKRNRFKTGEDVEEAKTKHAQPADKKRNKRKFKVPDIQVNNTKVINLAGLVFLFLTAVLTLALTSHLFTGYADQSLLNAAPGDMGENDEIRNWLGKFGARISQKLVTDWFGLAAFSIIPVLFAVGFKLLFKITLIPFKPGFKYTLFTLLWLPAFFGFFFDEGALLMLGGGVGQTLNNYLSFALGKAGAGLLIFFALAGFILINFNISLAKVTAFFGSDRKIKEESEPENTAFEESSRSEPQPDEEEPVHEADAADISQPDDLETSDEKTVDLSAEDHEESGSEQKWEEDEEDDLEIEIGQDEETTEKTNDEELEKNDEEEPGIEVETADEEELSDKEVNKKVTEFGEYDPKLDLPRFKLPTIELLEEHGESDLEINREELEEYKRKIVDTLKNYKIGIKKIKATVGPTVTLYEIIPEAGVRISKIKNLEDDIALSLSALGIRIIAPIPGRGTIGIEVPNQNPATVSMRSLIKSEKFQNSNYALPIALGKTVSNETFIADLAKMPHLLMAGATGQGKSVGLNAILVSLLYKLHPSQIKFVLVDPKKVELTLFNKIERHYLAKLPDSEDAIITDTSKVINTLNSLCIEMDRRYELLKNAMVRNLKEYNTKFVARKLNPQEGHRYLPYIVLVVDEFADLIMTAGKEVESPIARLAQLARAVGIHLIIATQRPSVNVITGLIKANFPARIAFRVTSKVDSRTILDSGGADQLIGRGDMLMSQGSDLIRLQCGFVDTPEVEEICEYIGGQQAYPAPMELPEYVGESESGGDTAPAVDEERDALFEDCARLVVQTQQGSASLLQRKLKIGYNRAGRIVDQLENAGIIGPFEGSKARQVLIPDEYSLEQLLNDEAANKTQED